MLTKQLLLLNIIDKFYFIIRLIIPRFLLKKIYQYFQKLFERTAIDSYLYDDCEDIGFFESIILGSDELKKFSKETQKRIQQFKRADMVEKTMGGFLVLENSMKNSENQAVKECIMSEKQMVVDVLKSRGDIIKYLGKRIAITDKKLYNLLERINNKIYYDLSLPHFPPS